MKQVDVPFIENASDRCLVACVGMVLKHFMPEKAYTMDELDELCGYETGRATWPVKHALALADMGLEVEWIQDFDLHAFAADPKKYLESILGPEALAWQIEHSNLAVEAARVQDYLDRKLPFERRLGTKEDVMHYIDDGWLVRLEVNANTLSGQEGYEAHAILAIDYDDFILHNPDGANGNKPNQRVSWGLLQQARKEYGGIDSIMAYRR